MWFAIGFCAACLAGTYLYYGWLLLIPAAAAIGAAGLCRKNREKHPAIPRTGIALLGLCAGFVWLVLFGLFGLFSLKQQDGTEQHLSLEITDYSWQGSHGTVADGRFELGGRLWDIRVYFRENISLEPGDRVEGTFSLEQTLEPGDGEPSFHRSSGIFLLGYQRGDISVIRAEEIPGRYLPEKIRNTVNQMLTVLFPEEEAAFARALLLGDKTGLSYAVRTNLKVSGISHVVAVSGLHMSILFAMLYILVGKRRLPLALLGIPTLLLFAAVAGFTPSVTRAAVMEILMILALLLDREYDPLTALSFAVMVILLRNPLAAGSVSFQLSVASVAGIFLLTPGILQTLTPAKKPRRKLLARAQQFLAGSIAVTLGAGALTTPLVAIYFGTVSLVGILSNILILWAVSLIFYALAAGCLLGLVFLPAGKIVACGAGFLIRYVLGVAAFWGKFPLAAVYTASPWVVAWLIAGYAMVIGWVLLRRPGTELLLSLVLSLCLCLCVSWLAPFLNRYSITVLDVGQGQCILLQSGGKSFVVDCGGDFDEEAADLAAETLLSQGVFRLDGLILTHYDKDHAGGAAMLLSRIPTEEVFLPDTLDGENLRPALTREAKHPQTVTDNTVISFGPAKITLFAPEFPGEGNESCVAVLFQTENCDILITGDMNSYAEERLLRREEIPDLEILIAGHHGSAYSTGEALLAGTSPEVVVISVGAGNAFGHPSRDTLARLEAYGCVIYRTDLQGTIRIRG